MGLLDEAIREHLELKRRRGADPDEVARQEDEALGPPQRGEFAESAGEDGPEPDDESAAEAEDPAPEDDAAWLDESAAPTVAPFDAEAPEPEPESEAGTAELADEPPPAASDEDVLEATPEFLEETPEHDRLWFEQKPPKDFDFDS